MSRILGIRAAAAVLLTLLAGCAPDFALSPNADIAPNAPPSRAALMPDRLIMPDGAALPLKTWLPRSHEGGLAPITAVILALHGFDDHATAFAMPAHVWAHYGIATFAYDQRGFGANPHAGLWPGADTLVADCATAVRLVQQRYPDLPVYLLGESMGGAVALDALGGRTGTAPPQPAGAILVAPAVWARSTMPLINRVALWLGARLLPTRTFTGSGLGILASDNFPMLRDLGRDPLFIKATRVDAIYGLTDLMDQALASAGAVTLPMLVLYGAHDQVIPPEPMRQFLGALPGTAGGAQRLAYYRDGWHMALRDIEGPLVAEDVVAWIEDHQAALPSGAAATMP